MLLRLTFVTLWQFCVTHNGRTFSTLRLAWGHLLIMKIMQQMYAAVTSSAWLHDCHWSPLHACSASLVKHFLRPPRQEHGMGGAGREEGLATVSAHLQYPPLRNQFDTSDNTILTLGWKHLELEVSSVGYTSILGNEMYVHCNNIFSPIHGS